MTATADLTSERIEGFAAHGGRHFSVPLFSQITDSLWMGGCPTGPTDFDHIVCLYPWGVYPLGEEQTHLSVRMFDSADVPSQALLYGLADTVNRLRQAGSVLVHCQAGLNRSGLVTALALIRSGMTPPAAIAMLRERRSDVVLCNAVFERWLLEQA